MREVIRSRLQLKTSWTSISVAAVRRPHQADLGLEAETLGAGERGIRE